MGGNILNVAICDDEAEHITRYTELLQRIADNNGIPIRLSTFSSGDELLFKMEDESGFPDLLYLDILMPGTMGVDAAKKMRLMNIPSEIVFLTKHPEYMKDAFDVEALNYILKQEEDERFERVFLQAVAKIRKKEQEVISFTCAGETRMIPVSDIRYFEVKNYVITVYYIGGQFEFYSTLGKIENALLGRKFIRSHRSFLIAIKEIKSLSRKGVVLLDGTELPMGRKYWNEVKEITDSEAYFIT